ncbi:anti-adapter protein IraM [Enterobacter cancerogenus]|uniref:anti-adapter protein IraM n=1 Tax=Enterobacter TaxID=547 RepID=UPI0030761530
MLNLISSKFFNGRGKAMSWRVISSIICPNTGIVYSSILGLKFLKLIIWYESDVYLYPGDRIYPTKKGVFINGIYSPISLYNVSPYNEMLWNEIKDKMACPFNKNQHEEICSYAMHCNARKCPHGFATNPLIMGANRNRH